MTAYDAATAPAVCPDALPNRIEVGDRVLCADAAFEIGQTTRAECETLTIACDVLYGCDAVAPELSACTDLTTTTADCGGIGPTVLGARYGEARWFTGGCVADGFAASPCGATDPCCVDGSPYPADAGYPTPVGVANEFLDDFRADPAALESAFRVDVVSGTVAAGTGAILQCVGSVPGTYVFNVACGSAWARDSLRVDDDSYRVFAHDLGTGGLTVDFRPDGGSGQVARVCVYDTEDIYPTTCPATAQLICADSGTVTLDTARISVQATFGAATVTAEFPR